MSMSPKDAKVEHVPLEVSDQAFAAQADKRLHSQQVGAAAFAVVFILFAWYSVTEGQGLGVGHTVACVLGAIVFYAVAIGFGRAATRDARLRTKEVITGVIRKRKRLEAKYNVIRAFDVGGIEVFVPADVFELFSEGELVCVERLSGSRSFLHIRKLPADLDQTS